MGAGIYTLLTIWSLFFMYLIAWKLKMDQYRSQMEQILQEAIEEKVRYVTRDLEDTARKEIRDHLKNVLVEAKVVDRSVIFKFTDAV